MTSAKNKSDKSIETQTKVSEPVAAYLPQKRRIRFSTIEDQGDILLGHSMSLTPVERLYFMYELNARVFKTDPNVACVRSNRITFSRFEYGAE